MATSAKNASDKPVPSAKSGGENPDDEGAAKPKGKKKQSLIIIGVLTLAIAGGAGWYFTKGNANTEEVKETPAEPTGPPKFISLEPFTVNLQREEADQFLQIGITLKIFDAHLEEKINLVMPEIRSKLLLLLSGKYPSELSSTEGKKELAQEIINEIDSVLGLPSEAKPAATPKPDTQDEANPEDAATADVAEQDATAPSDAAEPAADEPAAAETQGAEKKTGIVDVLFTSFIIQ